jgi:hypothetical protein
VIAKGEPWGRPAEGPAEVVVAGDDRDLADAAAIHAGARLRFEPVPASDFARAVGLVGPGSATTPPENTEPEKTEPEKTELACDALDVDVDGVHLPAVNMVVVGTPPDRQRWWSRSRAMQVTVDGRVVHDGRAVAVVVANGQFLRGSDVVPRGHPGDGRVEVQVYALSRRERRGMRVRLRDATHLPHPRIRSATGRESGIRGGGRVEVDGVATGPGRAVTVRVAPAAFTLLV